ncbi:hypothetical protein HDV00_012370 [Rhizophlyctis rosea]|nr:hypothetical protein HDV00_012370 [Rhizophlyctis rosea]
MFSKFDIDPVFTLFTSRKGVLVLTSTTALVTAAITLLRPKPQDLGPKKSTLNTSKFPKDIIILHHAGDDPSHALPSASLFVLKLESYLRLTQTPYEKALITSNSHPPKRKMPFISYNDTVVGDSSIIISYLTSHNLTTLLNPDLTLTATQKATATAIKALVEDKLYWIQLRLRWGEEFNTYARKAFFGTIPYPLQPLIASYAQGIFLKSLYLQGTGRHTREELLQFWTQDIDALSVILGGNVFMLGEEPSSVDRVVFGLLYNVLVIKELAVEFRRVVVERRNLVEFTERCLGRWWPELVEDVERKGLLKPQRL